MTPTEALQAALRLFDDSPTALARAMGEPVKRQNVEHWVASPRGVPAEHCPAIERATAGAVRCEDLRPDVDWSVLRSSPSAQEAA